MNRIFIALLVSVCFQLSAQTVTYDDIVSHRSAQELTGRKIGGNITQYTASNGVTYTIGTQVTYGIPTNGKYYNYLVDVTGEWIGILTSESSSDASVNAANNEVYKRVENRNGGVATIKKIQCQPIDNFNKKTSGCLIYIVFNRGGLACTNFEEALQTGELKTPASAAAITSDAALQELKIWKEKLDLQIITQEEYDAKKAELMKHIQ